MEECLASVEAQTFGDLEIILIDDGSTDGTRDIAHRFSAGDSRVRLIANEHNLGLVGNWNRCLELVRGEWVKFVFQDDLLHADCIEALCRVTTETTLLVACERAILFEGDIALNVREVYRQHQRTLHDLFCQGNLSPDTLQLFALNNFCTNPLGEPTAVMVRTGAFQKFGVFNPSFVSSCDAEYWLRVGVNAGADVVPEPLASFRVHATATSAINLSTRYYRYKTLDALVLLHEYMYSPHFGKLRQKARDVGAPLETAMRYKKHLARAVAEWAAQPPGLDAAPLQDLLRTVEVYPALRTGSIDHWLWRAANRFRNKGQRFEYNLMNDRAV